MEYLNNIPEELKELDSWVLWKEEVINGRPTKIPKQVDKTNANVTDESTWATYQEVEEALFEDYNDFFTGAGLVLNGNNYICIDLDDVGNHIEAYKKGYEDNIVGEFINSLKSYTEISPSGKGIHIWVKANLELEANRKDNIEMYQNNRYITMTGNKIGPYTEVGERTPELKKLYDKYLKPKKNIRNNINLEEFNQLCGTSSLSDEEVITLASSKYRQNRNKANQFKELYQGNWESLFESQSEADLSFCNELAFWTGRDPYQMDRIVRKSNLYRPKWDEMRGNMTYGERTILTAIVSCKDIYKKQNIDYRQKNNLEAGTPQGDDSTIKTIHYPNYTTMVEHLKESSILWEQVNEQGKVIINTGIMADFLSDKVPLIFVEGKLYLYDYNKNVYKECKHDEHKNIIIDCISPQYRTMSKVNDVAGQWLAKKDIIKKNVEELNSNPYVLNLKNGLLDTRTMELKEHTTKYLSTVKIRANYKEVTEEEGKLFIKFLNDVVPNKDNQTLLQEIMGYSLTGLNNAKKAFILYGESNTGKSVFLNIIKDLVGIENVSAIPFQELDSRFNTASLYGKTVNICADLPKGNLKDDSIFKQLTGGDIVKAEFKGLDPFEFTNKAKLLFSTNHLPEHFGDESNAFYNRLIIIPFNQVIPQDKQDRNLNLKLRKELDYIFMWALEGLQRLISNDMNFTISEEAQKLLESYKVSKVDNTIELIKYMIEEKVLVENHDYKYMKYNNELALHTISVYRKLIPYSKEFLGDTERRSIHDNRKDFQESLQKDKSFIDYKPVNMGGRIKKCYVISNHSDNLKVI